MKIAFISTRGIPNNYGGFEQFAEYISVGLAARGHEVVVYSPHFHPYKKDTYKGVRIKHIYSPETWMGSSVGSFFYDFASLKDALKKEHFDIIYEAGYTSIVPAYIWFNVKKIKYPIFTTNMDGLEYKRTKFNKWVQKFIFWEERTTVKHSHYLIADNMGIHDYYKEKYNKESKFLAYGADIHEDYDISLLAEFGLQPRMRANLSKTQPKREKLRTSDRVMERSPQQVATARRPRRGREASGAQDRATPRTRNVQHAPQ